MKLNVIRLNPKAEVAASCEMLEYTDNTDTYHNIEDNNIHTGKVRHPYILERVRRNLSKEAFRSWYVARLGSTVRKSKSASMWLTANRHTGALFSQ